MECSPKCISIWPIKIIPNLPELDYYECFVLLWGCKITTGGKPRRCHIWSSVVEALQGQCHCGGAFGRRGVSSLASQSKPGSKLGPRPGPERRTRTVTGETEWFRAHGCHQLHLKSTQSIQSSRNVHVSVNDADVRVMCVTGMPGRWGQGNTTKG
jgi:hypothetical protein